MSNGLLNISIPCSCWDSCGQERTLYPHPRSYLLPKTCFLWQANWCRVVPGSKGFKGSKKKNYRLKSSTFSCNILHGNLGLDTRGCQMAVGPKHLKISKIEKIPKMFNPLKMISFCNYTNFPRTQARVYSGLVIWGLLHKTFTREKLWSF